MVAKPPETMKMVSNSNFDDGSCFFIILGVSKGYLSNLDCEVTWHDSFLRGASIFIQLVVNSTRAEGHDGLVGEQIGVIRVRIS